MAKRMTHTAAFAHFGTKPRNVQWSWSARSDDGKTVVVTLWQDYFTKKGDRFTYERTGFDPANPDTRPGFRELMENLAWARDNCDGKFKVIVAIAKDRHAEPRSIADCDPKAFVMRLESLNTTTGPFVAVEEKA